MSKKKAVLGGAILCVLTAVALVAAACGGVATTTTAGAPTTVQAVTTTAASAGTVESYRSAMKTLWDKYGDKLDSLSTAMGSLDLSDPTKVSADQLKTLQDFSDSVAAYASGVAAVKAPADVAAAHATYVRIIKELGAALTQLVTAIQSKQTSDYLAATANLATVVGNNDAAMTEAQATLEKTLGFSLHQGSSGGTTTTVDVLGADAKTYTDSATGYSFKYPAAWAVDAKATTDAHAGGTSTSSVGAYDPTGTQAGGVFIDLMVISTYKLNITVTDAMIPDLQSEIQKVLDGLEGQASNIQIVAPLARTERAGLKGYQVTYTFDKDGVPATSTLYFLFKGDMEYQVSVQAATDHWDADQAIFTAMVAGFTAP